MRLKDKVAIVTGASQGIGESIARRFAAEGAKVVVNYSRNDAAAQAVCAAIAAKGGQAIALKADCSKVDEIDRLVAGVMSTLGTVDIVVNNAGVFRTVSVEETTEEIWDEQLDLNLKGTFFMTKAVVPEMKRKGRGKIINVSSIFGTGAGPNCPAYCASKGGVVNLTKALAVEIGRHGINVNSLAPGNIATPLNAHLRGPDQAAYIQKMRDMTPTGRDFLDPEELTGTAVYLASPDSDAVHGVTLLVDGGWSAW
ncbi:MAG: glucose 1-dehydrogenase [Proteobacteria bacterium]|nr:glucose 1-dehydrogenase [Pseudomonadota bacterium]